MMYNRQGLTPYVFNTPSNLGRADVFAPFRSLSFLDDLFGGMVRPFDSMPRNTLGTIIDSYRNDKGETVYEYNMAGFKEDEITVKTDIATGELVITAERDRDGVKRSFQSRSYITPGINYQDIDVALENGLLTVTFTKDALETSDENKYILHPIRRTEAPEVEAPVAEQTEKTEKKSKKVGTNRLKKNKTTDKPTNTE